MSPPPAPASGQITAIQVLRALAALGVVIGHAQADALFEAARINLPFSASHLLPWAAGVDLFFVISGFIMVFASESLFARQGAGTTFLRRRILRIVPLYWLMSGAYLALVLTISRQPLPFDTSAVGLLSSFLFLPFDSYARGNPQPFYSLGWTLNYEMFFYCVFALFIGWKRNRAVAGTAAALTLAVLAASLFSPGVMLGFWSQPIVLEFVLGMGIALAYRAGWRLPPALAYALAAAGLAVLSADLLHTHLQPEGWITPNDVMRLVCWGLPCALILGALTLMSPPAPAKAPGALARFWVKLGDASYALYLVHPLIVIAVRKVWLAAHPDARLGLWPMVALMIAGAILAALLLHESVEKPLTRWLSTPGAAWGQRPVFTPASPAPEKPPAGKNQTG